MRDGMVTLYKCNFTEEDWFTLALAFGFDEEDAIANIHVIKD